VAGKFAYMKPYYILIYFFVPNRTNRFEISKKTWISCEEYSNGNVWQVDPSGKRKAVKITMGSKNPGAFEAFAYDDRNKNVSQCF
jgi:hypothetical protein